MSLENVSVSINWFRLCMTKLCPTMKPVCLLVFTPFAWITVEDYLERMRYCRGITLLLYPQSPPHSNTYMYAILTTWSKCGWFTLYCIVFINTSLHFQVNVLKTKETSCKNKDCWKYTLHEVVKYKGKDSLAAQRKRLYDRS